MFTTYSIMYIRPRLPSFFNSHFNKLANSITVKYLEWILRQYSFHNIIRQEFTSIISGIIKGERNDRIDYLMGTMIEVPHAVLIADQMAGEADFISIGNKYVIV